ncbi:pilus assembly protein TadG-related protein [Phycicoccus mangrovi]|uniref:pilus assembly protein TadG-related protein n=1 Tax=Phycicoccus mangrovi TaxID=2840470 RepID=UPI001C0015FA|nr:pilus assembly protein TadG-related protein [Phycicoccus mangrovi]MBT9255930.1 hypothetical protein [Phycicoccus mangrovi]
MSRPLLRQRDERGYVAVVSGLLLMVLLGFSAFAVDVGHWYLEGQRAQRAADAAALAGVTKLPDDRFGAYAEAQRYAATNGFTNGANQAVVAPSLAGGSTRLRVDVDSTVTNFFGGFLGLGTTKVSRHATAEFAGPVPLGSPCNHFGDDPEIGSTGSSNCNGTGAFWANVGTIPANKQSGDAFQNDYCTSATSDGCTNGDNADYEQNGHVFTVTVRQPVTNLTIEAFDPAFVAVGDYCDLSSAKLPQAAALAPADTYVSNPAQRYAKGNTSPWCTGDQPFTTGAKPRTEFVVKGPAGNPWEPTAWPTLNTSTCKPRTFGGYNEDLSLALKKNSAQNLASPEIAETFRRWVTICTIPGNVAPGTYSIQVHTNGLGADNQSGHNRFSLRAYGAGSSDKDRIAVAGYSQMVLYANIPSVTTKFFLARVPSNSSGQFFNVNLFDIGDGAVPPSTVKVVPPTETGSTFSGCRGKGITNGNLVDCTIAVSSIYNGRWQTITVPIPSTYSCNDSSPSGCWVRLEFDYGAGSQPADTTSWSASLDGDPIRLVE